jgi:hypothetical protein
MTEVMDDLDSAVVVDAVDAAADDAGCANRPKNGVEKPLYRRDIVVAGVVGSTASFSVCTILPNGGGEEEGGGGLPILFVLHGFTIMFPLLLLVVLANELLVDIPDLDANNEENRLLLPPAFVGEPDNEALPEVPRCC